MVVEIDNILEILEKAKKAIKQEDIIAIVQTLYDSKNKETADRICNVYRLKGFEFLSKTYEKNNSA